MLKKEDEAEIENTGIERNLSDMLYLSQRISDGTWLTFETKEARNHKKQGHTKPADSLYHCPQKPWELAVHKYHEDAGYALDEVKAKVILFSLFD